MLAHLSDLALHCRPRFVKGRSAQVVSRCLVQGSRCLEKVEVGPKVVGHACAEGFGMRLERILVSTLMRTFVTRLGLLLLGQQFYCGVHALWRYHPQLVDGNSLKRPLHLLHDKLAASPA